VTDVVTSWTNAGPAWHQAAPDPGESLAEAHPRHRAWARPVRVTGEDQQTSQTFPEGALATHAHSGAPRHAGASDATLTG
jgi:hypothetical protein